MYYERMRIGVRVGVGDLEDFGFLLGCVMDEELVADRDCEDVARAVDCRDPC